MIKATLSAFAFVAGVNAIDLSSKIQLSVDTDVEAEADVGEYDLYPGLQITWIDKDAGLFQEVFSGLCGTVVFETKPGLKL